MHRDHHEHDHGSHDRHHHGEGHGSHGHEHRGGPLARLRSLLVPHSHDSTDTIASALTATAEGVRALFVSLAVLAVTAGIELAISLASGSVSLLADTIHNFADALTALPLGIAFWMGRRPANDRYNYGYGRAEDLAGVFIVVLMGASSGLAAYEAVRRLVTPAPVHHLWAVAVAGLVGFAGNEAVALYRTRVGRRIGSAALVADGLHARTDGLTSLAVVIGSAGVAAGWRSADPVVGLVITVAIALVLRNAACDVYRRLMDSVEPALVQKATAILADVPRVTAVHRVRLRWMGHQLLAEADIGADGSLTLAEGHTVAEEAHHQLLHRLSRLSEATIHVDPVGGGPAEAHQVTAHHFRGGSEQPGG